MLESSWRYHQECRAAGTTFAGNYKHPTYPDCLKWVAQSWAKLATAGVRKAAKRLGMSADPGPAIPGYVDENFHIEVDDTCKDAALTFDYERIHNFYEINYPAEVSEVLPANMTSVALLIPSTRDSLHP